MTDLILRPTRDWKDKSEVERISSVSNFLASEKLEIEIVVISAKENGHVTLQIEENIPVNKRGGFLLRLEQRLKDLVDEGITIWLKPVGDKSKLRQLRGITFDSDKDKT